MPEYFISHHHRVSIWRIFLSFFKLHPTATEASPAAKNLNLDNFWRTRISQIILRMLHIVAIPLQYIGLNLELFINILSANGGLIRLIYHLLTGKTIKMTKTDSSSYYTYMIGHLDWRTQLNKDWAVQYTTKIKPGGSNPDYKIRQGVPDTLMAELSIMASKLAYENPPVVKTVVTEVWNMNFVAQYSCWNECLRQNATHVFLLTDKAVDANMVVVAFRGTMPFNAYNWSTDFDFSWFELPKLGRVHVGFLEALGLGDRNDLTTFAKMNKKMCDPKSMQPDESYSGLNDDVIADDAKLLAFDEVTKTVKKILTSNKNAKLYVTGHSLGGALAILYSALLFDKQEDEVTSRFAAVYTYGQPRVGDTLFGAFLDKTLSTPVHRYFRVVYCSDMVPRVPFDDEIFKFRHSGLCCYFDSFFNAKILREEPNKNYFSLLYMLPMEMYALWELIFSFLIDKIHGEYYRETFYSTMFRLAGLIIPGVAAHSPVNYVNAVRLGLKENF